jgi:hypothetical protein
LGVFGLNNRRHGGGCFPVDFHRIGYLRWDSRRVFRFGRRLGLPSRGRTLFIIIFSFIRDRANHTRWSDGFTLDRCRIHFGASRGGRLNRNLPGRRRISRLQPIELNGLRFSGG